MGGRGGQEGWKTGKQEWGGIEEEGSVPVEEEGGGRVSGGKQQMQASGADSAKRRAEEEEEEQQQQMHVQNAKTRAHRRTRSACREEGLEAAAVGAGAGGVD